MTTFNFALTVLGLAWFSTAAAYGALFGGDTFNFTLLLVAGHMAIGFGITITAIVRR